MALSGTPTLAALVGRDGSIDWMCLPRFDSAACFAHLLGESNHGYWRIAPAASPRPGEGEPMLATRRQYLTDSLVLQSEFDLPEGRVRITDCMPLREQNPSVVRLVECLSGTVDMRMDLEIRFGYGSVVPWVRRHRRPARRRSPDRTGSRFGPRPNPWREDAHGLASSTFGEGQQVPFVLSYFPSHGEVARPVAAPYAIEETTRWWQEWADLASFQPHRWRDAVVRSAHHPKSPHLRADRGHHRRTDDLASRDARW